MWDGHVKRASSWSATCAVVAVTVWTGLAAASCASWLRDDRARQVVILLAAYFKGLRTVHVDVAGGALTMLVDTGGGATLVVPEVARRIGCTPVGRDVGHRMSGEVVIFARCPATTVRAGAFASDIPALAVFDVNALLPVELPRVDGVLALDAFLGHVVTLDWSGSEIRVWPRGAGPVRSTRVRIATGNSGRFVSAFAPVDTGGGTLWLLIDSGNLRGTVVDRHVIEQRLLEVDANGVGVVAVPGHPPRATHVDVADLIIDGALGVDTLLEGPLTLDLRAPVQGVGGA